MSRTYPPVSIIGAPTDIGAGDRGARLGPEALRIAGLGEALTALAKRFGHTPVRCNDTPGFIVNHAGRAFVPESLRVLSEGVADFASIDRILVDAAGFRIGPFGLMDLVGLDVAHAVMKSMYAQYYEEQKYRPSFLAEPRVAAGLDACLPVRTRRARAAMRLEYDMGVDPTEPERADPGEPRQLVPWLRGG